MRYYDGELSEEEAAELERTLDGQSARVVAGLDQLGSVLRAVSERDSEAAGDIAGSVLERIAADEAQPAPAAVAIRPAARWVAPAAVAALALAASVALYLGSGQEPPSPVARTASRATLPAEPVQTVAPVVAPPQPEAPAVEEEDVPPAVAIEAVDFGSHNGAIFMVSAGAEAEATPVVWLTDDAAPRTEPL
jgi:hypothetical protein